MKNIILASSSPRRHELLTLAGIEHTIKVSNCDETLPKKMSPKNMVKYLSKVKANAVLNETTDNNDVIIGADTIVCINNVILGKPKTEENAKIMLQLLSGKTHQVYTGVTVCSKEKSFTQVVKTSVTMKVLTDEEIKKYVESKEPLDKAGAYGIQGGASIFVEKISGDYFNIVGLPLCTVNKLLKNFE